jgi:phosphonate transport system ATP-binding protein
VTAQRLVACVEINALRCQWPNGQVALDVPQLCVLPGEHVALIGSNGAGKTTLLRCISGFVKPSSGQVNTLGRHVTGLRGQALRALRAEVGQVQQGLHLVQRVSVLDNVLMGRLGRLQGLAAWLSCARRYDATTVADAWQALAAVGLPARAHERADRLSGGERQKLAIARMLMQRPALILADEPTASLDPAASRDICALLRKSAGSAALITVVHEPALLSALAERVVALRAGRVVFDLPLTQVSEKMLKDLYASPDSAAAPAAVGHPRSSLKALA